MEAMTTSCWPPTSGCVGCESLCDSSSDMARYDDKPSPHTKTEFHRIYNVPHFPTQSTTELVPGTIASVFRVQEGIHGIPLDPTVDSEPHDCHIYSPLDRRHVDERNFCILRPLLLIHVAVPAKAVPNVSTAAIRLWQLCICHLSKSLRQTERFYEEI